MLEEQSGFILKIREMLEHIRDVDDVELAFEGIDATDLELGKAIQFMTAAANRLMREIDAIERGIGEGGAEVPEGIAQRAADIEQGKGGGGVDLNMAGTMLSEDAGLLASAICFPATARGEILFPPLLIFGG